MLFLTHLIERRKARRLVKWKDCAWSPHEFAFRQMMMEHARKMAAIRRDALDKAFAAAENMPPERAIAHISAMMQIIGRCW